MNTKTITSDVETSTDRFIELPDDIISKIISSLTLKQAVTTSAISTRWRDLWKHLYSGFIDFDGSTTIQDLKRQYDSTNKYHCRHRLECVVEEGRCKFVNWVNQVLPSHKCATIKRFRLTFDLREVPHHVINDWIQFASSKNVECLELDFSTYNIRLGRSEPWYDFPSGSHCRFQSLTTVSLKHVRISPETFEHLLGCPNLEELNVAYCLKRRKELCNNYKTPLPDHWNIVAPNLLSFTYCPIQYANPNLVLEYVPRLNYLNTEHSHWCRYGTNLLQLQELLSWYKRFTEVSWLQKAKDLRYNNLKTVKLIGYGAITDVEIIRYFLSRAPLLEKIIIDPCEPSCLGTSEEILYRESSRYLKDRNRIINLTSNLPLNGIRIPGCNIVPNKRRICTLREHSPRLLNLAWIFYKEFQAHMAHKDQQGSTQGTSNGKLKMISKRAFDFKVLLYSDYKSEHKRKKKSIIIVFNTYYSQTQIQRTVTLQGTLAVSC
ncbi:hypothetical protein ACFE04_001263 [Oxalis oulophora]